MLHGTIMVNDEEIGSWSAVRREHPPTSVNSYKVAVKFRDIRGVTHEEETVLYHAFDEGALGLAAEVFLWATDRIQAHRETPEEAKGRLPS